MFKKKSFYIVTIVLGIIIICAGSLLIDKSNESLSGVYGICIGVGAGAIGLSISQLYILNWEKKNPELKRQNEIEYKDERNTAIRNRAKTKAGNITQWLILGLAYINILIDAPLWVTLVTVGVFLSYNILGLYYMVKYEKEM